MKPLSTTSFGFRLNPHVILLAGAYSNSAMWPISFIHNIVDQGFYVTTLDYRDCGKNNWDTKPFQFDDIVDDVFCTLIANRIKCPHVIGASMGGSVALRLALKYPYSCKTLTLIGTTPGKIFADCSLQSPSAQTLAVMKEEMNLLMQKKIEESLIHRYTYFSNYDSKEIRKTVKNMYRRGINHNCHHGNAFYNVDSIVSELKNIHQRSIIIHGEDDEIFPIDHAWKMHHELPNSKLYILPNTNHHFVSDVDSIVIKHFKS